MADTVVLGFFNDEPSADDAVDALKAWDKIDDSVKLNAIGVLVLDENSGKIKTHKLGRRSIGKGAGIGILLAVIAPPTLLAGAIGGGALGALHRKGLGMTAQEQEWVASQLSGGKAAVGVLVNEDQVGAVYSKLAELGGTPESHPVAEEALEEAAEAAPAIEAAEEAAGDDLTLIDGVGPAYSAALRAGGVTTFQKLSEMTPEAIEQQLTSANAPLFAGQSASTWPRQAKLAADGDWAGLRRYIASTKQPA